MNRTIMGVVLVVVAMLYGCGGGGSGGGGSASSTVSGTASQGSALPNGTAVTLVDSKGVSKAATVGTNGTYSVVVDGLNAPFVLNAGGLYSFASGAGTTNINPLTNLSMQVALGTSTITSSTVFPTSFPTTFATVVAQLKTNLGTLYPSTVASTQTDFLNGNISIGSGVDLVLASTTITPPDGSGNFSITVAGQQVITGTTSAGSMAITPNNTAISNAANTLYPDVIISGKVTLNGVGLSGASVTLAGGSSPKTVPTSSDGTYSFNYVQNGSYTISAVLTGYTLSSSQAITINGTNVTGINFTATTAPVATYTISGQVALNGSGLSGVTVTLAGSNPTTAVTGSNGNYSFTGVANGTYTLSASFAGFSLSSGQSVTVSNANVSGVNFTATSGTWAATGSMNTARDAAAVVQLANGKVLVAGGAANDNSSTYYNTAEIYDPATGKWSATGSMLTARAWFPATLLPNGKVLVAGGWYLGETQLASAELYDPTTGSWSSTGSMNTQRSDFTSILLSTGKVLVTGGVSDSAIAPSRVLVSAELYDPATGSWSITGSMATARSSYIATLLNNGKVLVAGGDDHGKPNRTIFASAELYDPTVGTWSSTGSMTVARSLLFTGTLLANGKVLVVGGIDSNGNSLSSSDLYDPSTGTWAATGVLTTVTGGGSATLLPGGVVLVAGGIDMQGSNFINALATTEIYNPVTGVWTPTGSMIQANYGGSAVALQNGQVLIVGGRTDSSGDPLIGTELYTP